MPLRCEERELAPAGAEHMPLAPHDIAHIDVGKKSERLLPQSIDVAVHLQVVPTIAHGQEHGFAVLATSHHPTGYAIAALFVLAARLQGGMIIDDGLRARAADVASSVGLYVLLAEPFHLREAVAFPFRHMPVLCVVLFPRRGRSGRIVHHDIFPMDKISYLREPTGTGTVTTSPTLLPSMAWPTGDSLDSLALVGSASAEPTNV